MNQSRLVIKQATDRLPSPNGVALAIMELWDKDNTSVPQMAKLVETDPALSGRLLRLANAAAHGVRPVVSIREAIVRVGMRTVGQVAIAFSLVDQNRDGQCEAFDYPAFWSESLLLATIARQLSASSNTAPPDDIFACALLARIGRLALATVYPIEYSEVIEQAPVSLLQAEQTRFGFDHNDLSYELMRDYGVPEALALPAIRHERVEALGEEDEGRDYRIAVLVHIAWQLVEQVFAEEASARGATAPERVCQLAESALGIDAEALTRRLGEGIEQWQEWSQLLSLPDHSGARIDPGEAKPEDPEAAADEPAPGDEAPKKAILLPPPDDERFHSLLQRADVAVHLGTTYESVLRTAVQDPPDLLVIAEAAIPEDIENLCQVVRSTEWGKPIFIAVVADAGRTQTNAVLFNAGADAVIHPAISDADFQARLTPAHRLADLKALWQADRHDLRHTANELAISRRKFETLSLTDQLTELPNRRAGMEALERAWGQATRGGTSVGLLMLDIDHFKQVNDRYGHSAGDQVLVEAAKAWSAVTRTGDLLCRSGGEEFLVITTGTDVDGMVRLAARLQAATQAISIPWNGQTIRITASFGLALSDDSSDLEALLNTADKTLYIAKSKGRNRLCYRDGGQYRLTAPSG